MARFLGLRGGGLLGAEDPCRGTQVSARVRDLTVAEAWVVTSMSRVSPFFSGLLAVISGKRVATKIHSIQFFSVSCRKPVPAKKFAAHHLTPTTLLFSKQATFSQPSMPGKRSASSLAARQGVLKNVRMRELMVELREVDGKKREAEAPELNEHLRLRLGAASR